MARNREKIFQLAEAPLTPKCWVLLIGPLSRTWYRDQGMMVDLMLWLHSRMAQIAVVGNSGFQHCASAAAAHADVRIKPYSEKDPALDAGFLRNMKLCIALVARGARELETAGACAQRAHRAGVPALVVDDKGSVDFVPGLSSE